MFIFVQQYEQKLEHKKMFKNVLSPYHQLSPSSLLTSTRTRQLYEKKIMPRRKGRYNNIEDSLSWIIALRIRISLNPPLESNRNCAAVEIWEAAANYTVSLISTHAYQCVVCLDQVCYHRSCLFSFLAQFSQHYKLLLYWLLLCICISVCDPENTAKAPWIIDLT